MSVIAWVSDRVATEKTHLDVAACGRVSRTALEAAFAHQRLEAEIGGYVAEVAAAPVVDAGRAALGAMVGLRGEDVVFTESGGLAFAVLLDAWPLPTGSRIGMVPSEYGGNARVLRDRAPQRGWELVMLEVDDLGRVTSVPEGLDLLTFPHIASQRGVVQPAEELLRVGVPVVLDVAQSLGQVPVPAGAAAYIGTSRKWLCGPRGVGFACIDPAWQPRLAPPTTLGAAHFEDLRRFDSTEAHVAGRVALAHAARGWSPAVLPLIRSATAAARVLLQEAGGWQVVEPVDEPTGITTLTHPTADALTTRARLIQDGFVVSVVPTSRADDVRVPLLRVSTAAWVTPGDLEALAAALDRVTQ